MQGKALAAPLTQALPPLSGEGPGGSHGCLEGGKGPKVKHNRKVCGLLSVTGPKLQNGLYLCMRALPCPTPLPGALLPPSTETGGLGP